MASRIHSTSYGLNDSQLQQEFHDHRTEPVQEHPKPTEYHKHQNMNDSPMKVGEGELGILADHHDLAEVKELAGGRQLKGHGKNTC